MYDAGWVYVGYILALLVMGWRAAVVVIMGGTPVVIFAMGGKAVDIVVMGGAPVVMFAMD